MGWIANMSEDAASRFNAKPEDACISITAPDRSEPPPKLSRFGAVLRVAFHDFDPIAAKVNGIAVSRPEGLVAMTEAQAALIASFARAVRGRMNIVVHCAAGISRSGAVAEALLQAFPEYEDLGWQRMPNGHVRSLMKRALGLVPSFEIPLPPGSPPVTDEDVGKAMED